MAKSISITLPNGRSWPKKGDAHSHFKEMLGRYSVGSHISKAEDHSDLEALLRVYDAAVPFDGQTKTGSGISHFEKRVETNHPGHTTCFFVVRTDGTSIDFSYPRALDAAGKSGQ